ncbi:hypothetical protein [Enterocloster bolteae]|uniref:hypothetical protein n=1 Tax=Enterocloster bolteae TaxID=208479 RepID=UPI002A7F856C|nr:hypothetical protein [Enterocloster bolteae]
MITLETGRLRVELPEPGERPNDSCRFDRAGYIAEVVLDGGMHFCASEPRNLVHPSSGGRGLCNEYRFDVSSEAGVGEYFPKFGVGLIRKEDSKGYLFYRAYKDVRPYEIKLSHTTDSATYVTEPEPCLGYAMRTVKNIAVNGNEITMDVECVNAGSKNIHIQEFCHNFLSIDGMAVGSDYVLTMPAIPDQGQGRINNRRGYSGSLRGCKHGFTFCEFTAIDTDLSVDTASIAQDIPFKWRLEHKGARAFVEGEDWFVPGQINVWGVDHILSPEIVNCFTLTPGQALKWRRVWRFDIY